MENSKHLVSPARNAAAAAAAVAVAAVVLLTACYIGQLTNDEFASLMEWWQQRVLTALELTLFSDGTVEYYDTWQAALVAVKQMKLEAGKVINMPMPKQLAIEVVILLSVLALNQLLKFLKRRNYLPSVTLWLRGKKQAVQQVRSMSALFVCCLLHHYVCFVCLKAPVV
jgi:hypothetical protein